MSNITMPTGTGYRKRSAFPDRGFEPVHYGTTVVIRSDDVEAAEEEFMRTHVGRYVLPKALATAQGKKAKTVSAPIADVTRLMARVGEHIAPVESDNAPAFPDALTALPAELADMFLWDVNDEAIVSREQIEALTAQVARIAYATPKMIVRRKPTATLAETVAVALTTGKARVSVPTEDMARMLDVVAAQRAAKRSEGVAA